MSLSKALHDRASRAANNQILFGEFNDRMTELNGHMGFVDPVEWICECANDTCGAMIEMSPREYEALRRDGTHFFVAPSDEHFLPDVERVLEHFDRYWIVERTGERNERGERHKRRSYETSLPLRT